MEPTHSVVKRKGNYFLRSFPGSYKRTKEGSVADYVDENIVFDPWDSSDSEEALNLDNEDSEMERKEILMRNY